MAIELNMDLSVQSHHYPSSLHRCYKTYRNDYLRVIKQLFKKQYYITMKSHTVNHKQSEAVIQRYSVKKGVLKNIVKFTGKHLCYSLLSNKVAGLRRVWYGCFPVNFAKSLRTLFLIKHLRWMLLNDVLSFKIFP